MLRPKVHIGVLKYSSIKQNNENGVKGTEIFKYIIKPHDINIVENRTGISCVINTKHNRYDVKRGDKENMTKIYNILKTKGLTVTLETI
jgi:hypothetical protein